MTAVAGVAPPDQGPAAGGGPRHGAALAVGGCLAVSVASLALPATLAFDPWAWLVWGREVGELGLDTTGGPSWKPLPVLVTTVLSVAGGHAPVLWLVLARTAGLLALVAAFRLAARFAGPWAGALAAGLLVLTPDGGPRFLRLVAEGHTAPVTATLSLWAVDRHLAGRPLAALLAATAVALDRPEAWPFLALYAAWLWRSTPACRPVVAACLVAVPVLWLGGDWWGSGDAWHGADAARVVAGTPGERASWAWQRVARAVASPAWPAAAAAVATAWRRREAALLVLAAGAVAWSALVAAMSVTLGYAALSRFLLPAAAALCVLAGVGVVRVVAAARGRAGARAVVALLLAAAVPPVLARATSIGTVAEGVASRARLEADLDVVIDRAGGPGALLACGGVAIRPSDVPRVALAWKLDVPLRRVDGRLGDRPGVVLVGAGEDEAARLAAAGDDGVAELARSSRWVAHAVACRPTGSS
ncbi:MAG TPA: hypothetical protein VFW63_12450 [Acidimicrobiales bacterium]|nr:hypothetical protein [Acidimicrobiales bacterium]